MSSNEETDETPILEAISQKAGDPELFPQQVRELHLAGRALEAYKRLGKHVKHEPNRARARLQRETLQDLRVWGQESDAPGMGTLNGVGTRLVGEHQAEEDGAHISTLWFTVLFIPLWPIASYLVLPAQEGGWYFLARTPLVPSLRIVRNVITRGLVLAALVGAFFLYHQSTHVDIHVVNGFDVPVSVSAGSQELTVQAGQHALIEDLPAEPTQLSANVAILTQPLETQQVDLADHVGKTIVYNVASRAVVELVWIRYGSGEPPPGRLLAPEPVQGLTAVDYPFTTAPAQKEVREGGMIQNTVLELVGPGTDPLQMVGFLMGEGEMDHALAVARGELRVHPDRPSLVFVTATYLLGDDPEAGLSLFRECLEAAPDSVDLHRYYQGFWPYEQQPAVIAEYDALLEANPDSAMYHYLAGRLREDRTTVLNLYQRAMELDPEFPHSYRAYGYESSLGGDLDTAADMYERYAAFSPVHAQEVVRERVRVARWRGQGAGEIRGLLDAVIEGSDYVDEASQLRSHLAVAARPASLDAEMKALADAQGGAGVLEAQANLAITAGRLTEARGRLASLEDADIGEEVSTGSLLRLALSDGANASDRDAVRSRLQSEGAGGLTSGEALMALALAEREGWPEATELAEGLEASEAGASAELVRAPGSLSSARLAKALVPLGPTERAAAHYALALGASGGQRNRLRSLARRLGLPDELPWMR